MTDVVRAHLGETATVIGSGPSLLTLTRDDIGPGPVLTLNYAVLAVRLLGLPNPLYSLQKDGCLVQPIAPEWVIQAKSHSPGCWADYPRRVVYDVRKDLGLTVNCMSATMAVAIARRMGCVKVRMLGMDSVMHNDFRSIRQDGNLAHAGKGYLHAGQQATKYAAGHGVALEWA